MKTPFYTLFPAVACLLGLLLFSAQDTNAQYCTPSGSAGNTVYISHQWWPTPSNPFANDNTSGGGSYSNYTGLGSRGTLTWGSSYTAYLGIEFGSGGLDYWYQVYIDWNQDNDFDDSEELVYQGNTTSPFAGLASTSIPISIPCSATPSTTVRVRFMVKYNAPISGPCETGFNGEVEDYLCTVPSMSGGGCTPPDLPTIGATATTVPIGGSSTLSVSSGNLNGASNWRWREHACSNPANTWSSFGSGTSQVVSPLENTTYYVRGEGGCVTCPGACATSPAITVTGINGGTTLNPGDIVISCMNGDGDDGFEFIPLVDLLAGTTIYFTDQGWDAANGNWRADGDPNAEDYVAYVAPSLITAGTALHYDDVSPSPGFHLGDRPITSLSTSGDQVLAYQGTWLSPTFIAGINNRNSDGSSTEGGPAGWYSGLDPSSTQSNVPAGLTNGANCLTLPHYDNYAYTGITSGDAATLLAAVMNSSNWTGNSTTEPTCPAGFTLAGACVDPDVPTASAASSTICAGSSTTVSISSGNLNDATNWQWYTGSCGGVSAGSGTSISVNPATTTTYYVRGEGGCVTPGSCASVTVTVTPALSVSVSQTTAISCPGTSTGAILATPSGGNGSYSYAWSPSGSTASLSSLAAGTYTVTVTSGACSATDNITISDPSAINISSSVNQPNCNGGNDGSIDLTVTGGAGGYSYSWTGGLSGEDPSGVATGTYDVTVTDANSCTATTSISVGEPTAISLTSSVNPPLCAGSSTGSINLTVSGGAGGYSYSWTGGLSGEDPSGVAAGTYDVTVTDANSCTATTSVTLNDPSAINISSSVNQPNCNGGNDGSIDLTVTGGAGGYSYSWTGGLSGEDPSGVAAGTYDVTVTDAGSCTTTGSITVGEPTAVLANASVSSHPSSAGASDAVVTAAPSGGTGPYTYAWSVSAGSATTATVSGLSAGTYDVTVTDANSCTAAATVIASDPLPASGFIATDDCADISSATTSYVLTSGDFSLYGFRGYDLSCKFIGTTTVGGGREAGEPTPACGDATSPTSWYEFVAPSCGQFDIRVSTDNFGTNFDTWVAVYEATSGPCVYSGYVEVGCNDNGNGGCDDNGPAGASTLDLSTSLTAGSLYYVQIGGVGGASGNAVLDIQVAPSAPVLTLGASPFSQIDMSWTDHSADDYDLYISPLGSSGYSVRWNRPGTSYTFSGLTNGTTYEVWMRNSCVAGTEDYYSPVSLLSTQPITCTTPDPLSCGAVTASTITVNWTPVSPTTTYHIFYRRVGQLGYNVRWNRTGSSYTMAGLQPNTAYEIWIYAQCAPGVTNLSATHTCTTAPLGAVAKESNPSNVEDRGVTFEHNGVSYVNYDPYYLNLELEQYLSNGNYEVDFSSGSMVIYDANGQELDLDAARAQVANSGPFTFALIPNVTTNTTMVKANLAESGTTSIVLTDLQGKQLFADQLQSQAGQLNYQMDISQYPAGLYHVTIRHNGQQAVQKLIVMD